mmetsp:Transcript_8843/g.16687  ORF Transcript_8843/g.16687 Transcript_8843/m.16687 type:complete len:585 (-) Transcript_8843:3236-4990(-)
MFMSLNSFIISLLLSFCCLLPYAPIRSLLLCNNARPAPALFVNAQQRPFREHLKAGLYNHQKKRRHKKKDSNHDRLHGYDFQHSSRMNSTIDFADIANFIHGVVEPRDIIQGVKQAIITTAFGILSSICTILGTLYVMVSKGARAAGAGAVGGVFLAGTFGSITLLVLTFVTTLLQIILGIKNTPRAIFSAFIQGKHWDADSRQWGYYSLQEEEQNLFHDSAGYLVADTSFYDLLGVTPLSSPREIKRAYFNRAKDLHPDKNLKNMQAATEEFINLHKAYQILIDPKTRSNYDLRGASLYNNTSRTSGLHFDADVFFQILFGSQLVESYVGQFNVASFAEILKDQMFGYKENGTFSEPIDLQNSWRRYNVQKKKRYVRSTRNLLKRIQPFVENKVSRDELRKSCLEEADVIASYDFGEYYLYTIGNGLLRASRKWRSRLVHSFSMKSMKVIQDLIKLIRTGSPPVEQMMPLIMQALWIFVDHEVVTTIREASFRVLHESNEISKSERRKRALALGIIGKAFLERGGKVDHGQYQKQVGQKYECSGTEYGYVEARLDVAFNAATMEESNMKKEEAEQLIQKICKE